MNYETAESARTSQLKWGLRATSYSLRYGDPSTQPAFTGATDPWQISTMPTIETGRAQQQWPQPLSLEDPFMFGQHPGDMGHLIDWGYTPSGSGMVSGQSHSSMTQPSNDSLPNQGGRPASQETSGASIFDHSCEPIASVDQTQPIPVLNNAPAGEALTYTLPVHAARALLEVLRSRRISVDGVLAGATDVSNAFKDTMATVEPQIRDSAYALHDKYKGEVPDQLTRLIPCIEAGQLSQTFLVYLNIHFLTRRPAWYIALLPISCDEILAEIFSNLQRGDPVVRSTQF
jgi:hypothetical protein